MKQPPAARIGLLPTGHRMYWQQYPGLKERGMAMKDELVQRLGAMGQVVESPLVDTEAAAFEAAGFFSRQPIDILFIFPFGYTTGMCIAPVVKAVNVPIRVLNAHRDASYDYSKADTEFYLYHEGVCCVPEYAYTLTALQRPFKVRTGHFGDERLWDELEGDCLGAAAARAFCGMRFGVIGKTYTGMVDMPIDEARVLRTTGRLLARPEVEEIEQAYKHAGEAEAQAMLRQFEEMYDIEPGINRQSLLPDAKIAVAFETVVKKHGIDAFGYYWWGQTPKVTQLRAASALAVSRLSALGCPGVTEGDVKTAMALKVMELLGGGGMFAELICMDFEENFIMMGHDGPGNISVAQHKPVIKHLDVHHGKTGEGFGIDFSLRPGPVTLLNLTDRYDGDRFKMIYSVGEVLEGDTLSIGNPNCRVRTQKPIHQFIDAWCQQGPSHHMALGLGNLADEIEVFAEAAGFKAVRV